MSCIIKKQWENKGIKIFIQVVVFVLNEPVGPNSIECTIDETHESIDYQGKFEPWIMGDWQVLSNS